MFPREHRNCLIKQLNGSEKEKPGLRPRYSTTGEVASTTLPD
ncbi:hypothetical protein ACFQT0_21015 [Hymenobacter humi]|uniref:Uncharacterized protein n=1 Tax=Hymenobacter humi TaxID=1411620 RepID=A0ABW2UBI1_9BACT